MISARNVADATIAIENGVDLLDIKEPRNGPLGMAAADTAAAIAGTVPTGMPVGVSLGEWFEWRRRPGDLPVIPREAVYLKVGLSDLGDERGWHERYREWRETVVASLRGERDPLWVAVVYADWQRVRAPSPEAVLDLAGDGFAAVLVDTASKSGRGRCEFGGLFDCLDQKSIEAIVRDAHARHLEVVLSGSLTPAGVIRAAGLGADIVGVRTAACAGGRRDGKLDPGAVRRLVELLTPAAKASAEPYKES